MAANKVREMRIRAGLSLRQLARMAGYDHSVISRVERGKQSPSYRLMLRVSEALHIPPGEIFFASDGVFKTPKNTKEVGSDAP